LLQFLIYFLCTERFLVYLFSGVKLSIDRRVYNVCRFFFLLAPVRRSSSVTHLVRCNTNFIFTIVGNFSGRNKEPLDRYLCQAWMGQTNVLWSIKATSECLTIYS